MGCDMLRCPAYQRPRSRCCPQDALLEALGVTHGATKLPHYKCYVRGQVVQVRCRWLPWASSHAAKAPTSSHYQIM